MDPKDSLNFGFSLGFFLSPSAEIGFLWRRQATEIEIAGTAVRTLGDANIDGYHGYGALLLRRPRGEGPPATSWAASARPTTAACRTPGRTARRPRPRATRSSRRPGARGSR
ncbi:MAG: hypothetical protein MZV64_04765 [Ignavibacteriales bacterium]|nr:hypothetical protein [Ignavibacteriales bacterium]